MKIETPQILWHNSSEGNGKPAPLYSVSILPCPSSHSSSSTTSHILATAGNTNEVHIWNVTFPTTIVHNNPSSSTLSSSSSKNDPSEGQNKRQKLILSPSTTSSITLITSITRHQRSVNVVSFSPNGTHLATAGDGGSFIIHSVPVQYRYSPTSSSSGTGNGTNTTSTSNGQSFIEQFWKKELQSEKDLNIKVLNTHSEDIMDLSWSKDEKRVIVGSLDHSVFVFEEVQTQSQAQMQTQSMGGDGGVSIGQSGWSCVWRNTKEHTHYVQGVAYDPLGVYLASQGSDRSVRVWQRKRSGKGKGSNSSGKKKVLAPMDSNVDEKATNAASLTNVSTSASLTNVSTSTTSPDSSNNNHNNVNGNSNMNSTTNHNSEFVSTSNELLMGKFEVGKAKVLKFRTTDESPDNQNNIYDDENANTKTTTAAGKARYLFADESTVESFFRRLEWTNDGAFLITPASLWHSNENNISTTTTTTTTNIADQENQPHQQQLSLFSPSFATYLFARHQFERPFKVLSGLEKPSVVIRPNPVFFKLPNTAASDLKENVQQTNTNRATSPLSSSSSNNDNESVDNIPYRSIFAVLTVDSVLIYDTHHARPLCIARGLHYAGLTDCSWSSDGRNLVVCSTDGYVSILSFAEGELGEVYTGVTTSSSTTNTTSVRMTDNTFHYDRKDVLTKDTFIKADKESNPSLPPCEPGQSATIYAPPSKRAKVDQREKKRVVPTLLSSNADENTKNVKSETNNGESNSMETEEVVGAVTNLSINNANQIRSIC